MKNYLLLALLPLVTLTSNTAYSASFSDDLTTLDPQRWFKADGWQNGFPFVNSWQGEAVSYDANGMEITLNSDGEGTVIGGEVRTIDYFGYGCYEVEMKPIKQDGVVSAFFLFAGPYDTPEGGNGMHNEIDIEFLGANTNMVQLNYWTNDDDYQNSNEHLVLLDFDASEDFHRYGIKWTKRYIEWYVDGQRIHRAKHTAEAPTPKQTDSKQRVMMNVWATHEDIAYWAGRFDMDAEQTHSAYYKNFSYTAGKRCSIQ